MTYDRKLILAAALIVPPALATLAYQAEAHCYSVWNYPTPQRCGGAVSHASFHVAKPDRSYYVEITSPPPIKPDADDPRTPEEIQDFDEHYFELEKHKDDLNKQLMMLRVIEDAHHAAGLE